VNRRLIGLAPKSGRSPKSWYSPPRQVPGRLLLDPQGSGVPGHRVGPEPPRRHLWRGLARQSPPSVEWRWTRRQSWLPSPGAPSSRPAGSGQGATEPQSLPSASMMALLALGSAITCVDQSDHGQQRTDRSCDHENDSDRVNVESMLLRIPPRGALGFTSPDGPKKSGLVLGVGLEVPVVPYTSLIVPMDALPEDVWLLTFEVAVLAERDFVLILETRAPAGVVGATASPDTITVSNETLRTASFRGAVIVCPAFPHPLQRCLRRYEWLGTPSNTSVSPLGECPDHRFGGTHFATICTGCLLSRAVATPLTPEVLPRIGTEPGQSSEASSACGRSRRRAWAGTGARRRRLATTDAVRSRMTQHPATISPSVKSGGQ
jgi:hypothetical protein